MFIELPNQLAVCWNNSSQLMFYSFGKLTKGKNEIKLRKHRTQNIKLFFLISELESKSEYLMPVSSEIKFIETTKCNTLIALVLKNNNIVVFDLNTGK